MTGPVTKPIIRKFLGGYEFMWCQGGEQVITLTARRVHEKSGDITAEISIDHLYGETTSLISLRVNLSVKRGRDEIVKRLIDLEISKQLDETVGWVHINWTELIEQVAGEIIQREREGDPGLIIEPSEGTAQHPGYLIEPIITRNVANVIYGDKGVNKTTLGITLLGLVQTGGETNPIELDVKRKTIVGLLDWESTPELTQYTVSRLVSGGTVPSFKLPYLRCEQSLADDIERIGSWIANNKIELILIDSLGQAAGTDRFDSSGKSGALLFFRALRQLNVSSLIIAQNAKNEETNRKTIYGSTFFSYYARGIFELKRPLESENEDSMHLALIHQESNYSRRYPPVGLFVIYSDSAISICREPVSLSEFLGKVSKTKELFEFLKDGAKSVQAIGIELELSDKRTRTLLSQQKTKGRVTNIGSGMWRLLTEEV